MLAFSSDVLQAVNNPVLTEPQRYALRRLAELLGQGAHFTQSAHFVVDPVSAAEDLRGVLDAYADPDDRLGVTQALPVVRSTRRLLAEDRNGTRFFEDDYRNLAAELGRAAKMAGKLPPAPRHAPGTAGFARETNGWRSKEFKKLFPALDRALDQYLDRAAASAGGYRARLRASVRMQMRKGLVGDRRSCRASATRCSTRPTRTTPRGGSSPQCGLGHGTSTSSSPSMACVPGQGPR